MTDSARQREHYTRVHEAYEAHYYDHWSLEYRRRFMLDPLLEGVDLNGKRLADLCSGSGHNTLLLRERFPGLTAVGFDISPPACRDYQQNTGFASHELDLTKHDATQQYAGGFDAVVVVGGLHHCVADLPATIDNIHRLLAPGGVLLMFEPNADYVLEAARSIWYRNDELFDAETERALTHAELVELAAGRFDVEVLAHLGGLAYFVVLNSMIVRIPLWLKPMVSPPALGIEQIWNRFTGRRSSAYFVARWRKCLRPA